MPSARIRANVGSAVSCWAVTARGASTRPATTASKVRGQHAVCFAMVEIVALGSTAAIFGDGRV